MQESSVDARRPHPAIFVNYRREDCGAAAQQLAEDLQRTFGSDQVFFDSRSSEPGASWPQEIREALQAARVVVVCIGPRWHLQVDPNTGRNRLDDEDDWVRTELVTAGRLQDAVTARKTGRSELLHVQPVLLDGCDRWPMEALTRRPDLSYLSRFQAITLRDGTEGGQNLATLDPRTRSESFERLVSRLESFGLERAKVSPEKARNRSSTSRPEANSVSPPPSTGRDTGSSRAPLLYLSYVSHDTKAVAERLSAGLVNVFGRDQVFFDQHLQAGADWRETLLQRLDESTACLVLIGEHWSKRVSERGAWVRSELAAAVEAAIEGRLVLLPLLVDGAGMPKRLPPALAAVGDYHAIRLRSDAWEEDVDRLIARLRQLGFEPKSAEPAAESAPFDHAAATDLCTLAFRLVIDFKAQPELLRHFEPDALLKALMQWETENGHRSEAPAAERTKAALEQLAAKQPGHAPNALWLAWMLETQSFRLQRLQQAVAAGARQVVQGKSPDSAP